MPPGRIKVFCRSLEEAWREANDPVPFMTRGAGGIREAGQKGYAWRCSSWASRSVKAASCSS